MTLLVPRFGRPAAAALWLACAAGLALPAAAQTLGRVAGPDAARPSDRAADRGAFATAPAPSGPRFRVLDEDAASVTLELTADWGEPLAAVVAREASRSALSLMLAASGGQTQLSHEIDLGAAVPPPVTVLSEDVERVPLPPALADALRADWAAPQARVVNVGTFRRRLVGSVEVWPARVVGGELVRVRRLVLRVPRPALRATLAARGGGNPHLAVTRSVLADGQWFKVPVSREGVYRITAAWLRDSLGVAAPDLARVAVYGNGGRRVPVVAGAPRTADLAELPSVQVGDAVLFHAFGPSWWDWLPGSSTVPGRWVHDVTPFSRVAYVFVRVDAPAPRRLAAGAFPGWPDARPVAEVDARLFAETDRYNHARDGGGSGLDWMGQTLPRGSGAVTVLDTLPPGVPAGATVRYRTRVAARAPQSSTVSVTGAAGALGTISVPLVFPFDNSNIGDLLRPVEAGFEAPAGSSLRLAYRADGGGAAAESWLDWAEAVVARPAAPGPGGVIAFPTPGGQAGRFEVALGGFAQAPLVWDVTVPGQPAALGVTGAAGAWRVQVEADSLQGGPGGVHRELVAFDPAGADVRTPAGGTPVATQNLHGVTGAPTYLVVAHPDFLAEAQRLAEHRRAQDGLVPLVVTTEQVFNEFAGGAGDMGAVRDFAKLFYDRAATPEAAPRYLLLFGDGHYDYRNLRTRTPTFVPVFETENMVSRLNSYTSDDWFGLLDDTEGAWVSTAERLDLAIGRFPVQTPAEAALVVDKVLGYEDAATRGPWRQRFTYVGDDQHPNNWDTDLHVYNADFTSQTQLGADSTLVIQKIYGPSYPAVNAAGGVRRPQAVEDIVRTINEGTLVWNYSGHGGPEGLGDEQYFTRTVLDRLVNGDRLPLFITATCSFGRFDMAEQQSLAEETLLHEGGGSVAMLTTVRVVFTGANPQGPDNFGLNVETARQLVARDADGRPRRMGDALLAVKNTVVGAALNNRKFNLLGDPALRLGLPEGGVAFDAPPSLAAYEEATVRGTVLTPLGQPDLTFDGEVDVTVFDAERIVQMPQVPLPGLPCCNTGGTYRAQTDRIYAGRASVRGGQFAATFRVPQDVSYSGGRARVVAYAVGERAAGGATTRLRVSTQPGTAPDDGAGPDVRLFLGDTTFVSGGLAPRNPVLVARLRDPSGINTVGTGVGHELLLTIDGNPETATDVSRFYTGDLDTYRSGTVRYPLPALAPGPHTATLTAWDALNNPSTAELSFVVGAADDLAVRNSFPYPNPTAGPTRFTFEHNQPPATPARVQLRIFTLAGRVVRTIDGDEALPGGVLPAGLVQVPWDGRDADGVRLATGVYLYRLRLDLDDGSGQSVTRVDRLAIIR